MRPKSADSVGSARNGKVKGAVAHDWKARARYSKLECEARPQSNFTWSFAYARYTTVLSRCHLDQRHD